MVISELVTSWRKHLDLVGPSKNLEESGREIMPFIGYFSTTKTFYGSNFCSKTIGDQGLLFNS